jgi:hypothetical protein
MNEIDLLVEKHLMRNEGIKWDRTAQFLSSNMDTVLKMVERSARAIRLNRLENMTDKQKALLDLQKQAKKTKEDFILIIHKIGELQKEIQAEEE